MPGDGRKSQRGVSTDGRGGFWHSPRSCPEPLELVGLKFSWSPTRLYRRVERVGTTGEPLRLEARESQSCSVGGGAGKCPTKWNWLNFGDPAHAE